MASEEQITSENRSDVTGTSIQQESPIIEKTKNNQVSNSDNCDSSYEKSETSTMISEDRQSYFSTEDGDQNDGNDQMHSNGLLAVNKESVINSDNDLSNNEVSANSMLEDKEKIEEPLASYSVSEGDSSEVRKEEQAEASSTDKLEVKTDESLDEDFIKSANKEELFESLQRLLEGNVLEIKEEVEKIKSRFYNIYNIEQQNLRKQAEEAAERFGEKLVDWQPVVDSLEEKFKELINVYKSKRADALKKVEEEINNNLLKKENILLQLKTIVEAETADVMGNIKKVKDLQVEWKSIGRIPPQKTQEINKQYTGYLERFYDLVKINYELRDLDFKKNLEMKTLLCEAAERLKENPSIVEAGRALQQLHEEWAEIGPVAKEYRQEIWNRFKEASAVINKKHQAYFEELHRREEENYKRKQSLINDIKEINIETLTNVSQWNDATEKILAIREEWDSVGRVPKKHNTEIYETYRKICHSFFKARNDYFKDISEVYSQNLDKKQALIDKVEEIKSKVEELKDSEDWKKASDVIIAIQKEWRTIGAVPRRKSQEIWDKFRETCNEFFALKKSSLKEAKIEVKKKKDDKVLESGDKKLLRKMATNLQQEIKIAENNILFFTAKSSTANKLVDDMKKKIEDLKTQLQNIENKIKNVDKGNNLDVVNSNDGAATKNSISEPSVESVAQVSEISSNASISELQNNQGVDDADTIVFSGTQTNNDNKGV